ncbi:retrotransposon protein, putative, ty1-copia subclass [Tanacetum coccineum]
MENSKRRSIPMQDKLKLYKSQDVSTLAEVNRMQRVPYASTVGSIILDMYSFKMEVLLTGRVQRKESSQPHLKKLTITIANEPGITKAARHYRVKVHYLREVIEFGNKVLEKVHTNDNVADPFTKDLPFNKHSEHTKNIGKTKLAYAPKSKIPPLLKKDNPAKDVTCHQCSEVGHWRRNCP